MPTPKHILVIRLSAMGDVAMTVNVLKTFSNTYPDVKLTVLTRAFFTPFFRDLPNVTVFPDAVADLHNVLRSKILKLFFFGRNFKQIDKGRKEKKALVKGQSFQQLKTTHERYADVFKALGFPIDLSNPSFPEPKELNNTAISLIGQDIKKCIAIAPFAQYQSKMYPLFLMKEVIKELEKENKILLFGGGKKEIEQLEDIASNFKNVINIAGKFNLNEELDVISNCNLMLSMDSGNGHLAAMLGLKVITIWGVTHPFSGFTPFNQPKNNQLLSSKEQYPKIPTSVYGNKYPKEYKSVASSIKPSQVIARVKEY